MFKPKYLNYSKDTMSPYISENTFNYHYEKHYIGYINKTNEIITSSNLNVKNLQDIIMSTDNQTLYNNASQVWNHEFFWESMKQPEEKKPYGKIAQLIKNQYESEEAFYKELFDKSLSHFGSGWSWVVLNRQNELKIYTTSNADNPLKKLDLPIITIDLWEHSYYLDYQNNRAKYLENFLKYLINWEFANKNLENITL